MCGIVGYISTKKNAVSEALKTLKKLEYRGYDSAGIAYLDNKQEIKIKKAKGKIKELEKKIKPNLQSMCAIAHTRWATHGEANEINAHPHYGEQVVLVQNGIIENYEEIKQSLIKRKINFYSQTDTEVITKLIDYEYLICKDQIKAIRLALNKVKGSFAILLMFKNTRDTLYAISNEAPLVITKNKQDGFVVASDVNSLASYGSQDYWFLANSEIAIIKNKSISFLNDKNQAFNKKAKKVVTNYKDNNKNGFSTFMLKEINEQTNLLINFLKSHVNKHNIVNFEVNKLDLSSLKNIESIRIIGCGSAYNSGLMGKYLIESLANIKVDVLIASEFRYAPFIKTNKTLNILISQSGETADTIASLRLLKKQQEKIISITNNITSTIANESDYVINMNCGTEFAVASTKAYTLSTFILHLLAFKLGQNNKKHNIKETDFINQAYSAIYKAHEILDVNNIAELAPKIAKFKSIFFIGRGINYALCAEASLKLKELSYLNCNAYPAGELKHGPISLIDKKTLTFSIMANDDDLINEKTYSNIKEISARNGNIINLSNDKLLMYLNPQDIHINNHATNNCFSYLSTIYLIQLIAYHVAIYLNNDVDNPRNLAKSVTVE